MNVDVIFQEKLMLINPICYNQMTTKIGSHKGILKNELNYVSYNFFQLAWDNLISITIKSIDLNL